MSETFDDLFGQPEKAEKQATHLEKMRADLAARYGIEDPTMLQGRALELQALRDNGLLISVHCHGTGMFSRRATWEELGIPRDDPRVELLRQGMKDIIPSEVVRQLKSLETRKRANLDRYGIVLPAFPGFRWVAAVVYKHGSVEEDTVTPTDYEQWKEKDAEISAELEIVKEHICQHLAEWTDTRLPEVFGQIAERAWQQIRAISDLGETLESFRFGMIQSARRQMPTVEEVRSGLYFTHTTDFLLNPADVAQEMADRDRVRTESEADLQIIRARGAAEAAELRAREDIAWETRRTELVKLQAMREAEIEHAKKRLEQMGSPFQAVLDQVESQLYEAVQNMIAKVQEHGRVRGKTREQAMNAIQQYQTLRALGGDRLHAEVSNLESALDTPGEDYKTDPEAVLSALRRLASETLESARRVSRSVSPSRAAYVDL
jgi:hypothetical protein